MNPARNEDRHRAAIELRRGNRTVPIPSGKRYRRRPKHGGGGHHAVE